MVNSAFVGDRCYASGPDLGGGAIRAVGMYMKVPVYITHDTFTGNSCSNGAALSGLYANFYVINSLMTNNKAIGFGANPAGCGTAGGGSGGAIYTDGNSYNLTISGTVDERQHRPRGRRRHLLRGRRRRRDAADRRYSTLSAIRAASSRTRRASSTRSTAWSSRRSKPALRSARLRVREPGST